ncbi:MAG: hypothetical protein KIT68_02470 [Phycisphaeraceae bacterium]|nr:hypothetical protein [Phycisphaeraceae bacterium]
MRAILIRVGADGTDGGGNWVAPVDPDSGRFVYIPIPENAVAFHPGCERRFDEVAAPLASFLKEHSADARPWRTRIDAKRGQPMHLDPDFEHLTYGDSGDARGRDLRDFRSDDLIAFYSALKPIRPADALVYALVGVYVVDEVVWAPSVDDARRGENAHTRKADRAPRDIVVRARPGVSGRCERCIPVGEKRGTSNYYLRRDVESAWGGLVKADGSPRKSSWLNMSGSMPLLGNPEGFAQWWAKQSVPIVRRNFIA